MRVRHAYLVLGIVALAACSDATGPTGSGGGGGGGGGASAPGPTATPTGAPMPNTPGEGSPAPCVDVPRYLEPLDGPVKGGNC